MYSDLHIHTSFSGDSDASPVSQIEKALALGMKHICFTDHNDYDVVSDIDFDLDIPRYFEEMNRLKAEYADRIDISIGIEQGLQPHIGEYLHETAEKYPFDFIIGSVHFIDGYDPYYPEYFGRYRGKAAYERYFETVLECMCASGDYDSLGHLDYIVRYGSLHGLDFSCADYADCIGSILDKLIDSGKALECNTGGMKYGKGEPNPCTDILKVYREKGGELITVGSDAHSPDDLGYGFERCGELLKSIGFRYCAVYRNRKPEMIKL